MALRCYRSVAGSIGTTPERLRRTATLMLHEHLLQFGDPNMIMYAHKPGRRSSRQSLRSFSYFSASQLFGPQSIRCGGSKTTRLNVSDGKGVSRKSISTSGSMISSRLPPLLDLSFSVCVSRR
ncbi:hypothetical protein PhaeoP97_02198 [Phaeobacter porticola]|uniref:Uncharacterized protein n=1 Tax=Phaeobacter porticola TaxID=1844006 RepID=A0A1L3I690_9RHOB|nr:hypothetical protein PhaeoP97_02198 [Phaeobacter porticola]